MTLAINPKVVDLSHYDNVGPTPAHSTLEGFQAAYTFGIRGVINKATEGPAMVDLTFASRRAPAIQAGLLYGAYHFLRPGSMGDQVQHFLAVAQADPKLLLALDHEDPHVPLGKAQEFCERVYDKVGRYPILYSGFLIKQQLGNRRDGFWAGIRLWLSHYSANPKWPACWSAPWLWQFSGDGVGPAPHNVPGITIGGDGIDINSYSGSDEQLAQEWAA